MNIAAMMQDVVGTQYIESPLKEKYEAQVRELNEKVVQIANSSIKDELSYMVTGIAKLTSMMLDCEQYEVHTDEPILVDRVIKINRYIKSLYFNLHGIDHVVIGGLFCVAPVYLLPADRVHAASKNRYKMVTNPTEFGLPSESECNYGTIKALDHKTYVAIAKFPNSYINEIVNSIRHYDYVFLR